MYDPKEQIDKFFNDHGMLIKAALLILSVIIAVGIGMFATGGFDLYPDNPEQDQAANVGRSTFVCPDGKSIVASFTDGSVALELSDGRNLSLFRGVRTASEVEFANPDRSFIFAYEGNRASIVEGGVITYGACIGK